MDEPCGNFMFIVHIGIGDAPQIKCSIASPVTVRPGEPVVLRGVERLMVNTKGLLRRASPTRIVNCSEKTLWICCLGDHENVVMDGVVASEFISYHHERNITTVSPWHWPSEGVRRDPIELREIWWLSTCTYFHSESGNSRIHDVLMRHYVIGCCHGQWSLQHNARSDILTVDGGKLVLCSHAGLGGLVEVTFADGHCYVCGEHDAACVLAETLHDALPEKHGKEWRSIVKSGFCVYFDE
jgi:hypothetical protein